MGKPSRGNRLARRARIRDAAMKLMLAYPEIFNEMLRVEPQSWRQPTQWHEIFDAIRFAPFTQHRLHILANGVRGLDRRCREEQKYGTAYQNG